MKNPKIFVPAEYFDKVLNISKGVFKNDDEITFLKSCLYFLQQGINADKAIEMAMTDYLVDI